VFALSLRPVSRHETNRSSPLLLLHPRPRLKARCSSHPELESNRRRQKEQTMWTKQQAQAEAPSAPAQAAKPSVVAFSNPTPVPALGSSPARGSARLGASLQIKGHITGTEDLQIDGKVEGSITLRGHQLTVGSTAQLNSEIHAGEVIVYGKVVGNVHSRDRVDVKTDGSI